MKKIIILLFLMFLIKTYSTEFIISPSDNEIICYTEPIKIKWSTEFLDSVSIFSRVNKSELFPIIKNFSVSNNEFYWKIDDTKYFNKPITLIITDGIITDSINILISEKPEILYYSPSDIVCLGTSYQIKVETIGVNLKYQWFKDGTLIPNAIASVLFFDELQFQHSGIYTCEISNDFCEKINSPNISLYVLSETQIIEQPKSLQFYVSKDAVFQLKAHQSAVDGNIQPQYRWFRDSLDTQATLDNFKRLGIDPNEYPPKHPKEYFKQFHIYKQAAMFDNEKYEGTHTDRLKVKNVAPEDRVNYICKITGKCGTVFSNYVTIGDNTHFKITKLTGDFFDCSGQNAKFKIKVDQFYPGTITYRWFKTGLIELHDNEKYSGTKTDMLIVKNVQKSDNFAYYCLVTLEEYSIWERCEVFVLDSETKPSIGYQTKYYQILDPSSYYYELLNLEIRMNNKSNCEFTWYKDGKLLKKEVRAGLSTHKLQNPPYYGKPSDAGKYVVHIKNICGEVWSDTMVCVYGQLPTKICEGNDALVSVEDTNDVSKYFYTWKKGTKIITESSKYIGAKKNTLIINDVNEKDDHGKYELYGTNYDNGKSFLIGVAWLFVAPKPYMQKDLPESLIYLGSTIQKTNFVVYTKSSSITYQMYFNDEKAGNPITEQITNLNQTSIILTFSNNQFFIGDGVYQFHFKDDCGEVWSKKMEVKKYQKSIQIDDSIVDNNPDIVKIIAGIDAHLSNKINIYPNPVNDKVNITINSSANASISIYSIGLTGIEIPIIEKIVSASNETVLTFNTDNLQNGLNILKIKIDNKFYIFKLIVMKN